MIETLSALHIDNHYKPKPWRCGACLRVLGLVMRVEKHDQYMRLLWVFTQARTDGDIPSLDLLTPLPKGMFSIHGLDSANGIECPECGMLTPWVPHTHSKDRILQRYAAQHRNVEQVFNAAPTS